MRQIANEMQIQSVGTNGLGNKSASWKWNEKVKCGD